MDICRAPRALARPPRALGTCHRALRWQRRRAWRARDLTGVLYATAAFILRYCGFGRANT